MPNKIQTNKKRFFYPDEYEKMLDYCNKNQKHTAICLINTGARKNEVRHIEKKHKSPTRKKINIKKDNTDIKEVEKKVKQLHREEPITNTKKEIVNIKVTVNKELKTKIK